MAQRVRNAPDAEPSSGALVDEADIELVGHADPDDGADDAEAPMDRLLAETDDGWDVDEQRLTLKQAAATMPRQPVSDVPAPESPPATSVVPRAVSVPTPFDLAPTRVPDKRLKAPPKLPKPPPPLPRKVSLTPTPSGVVRSELSPVRTPTDMTQADALIDLLGARVATLEGTHPVDAVSLARAHMELAIASETVLGDDARALKHAALALGAQPGSAAAHAFHRRKEHGRSALASMLGHIDKEIVAATAEAHKVELLAEKARTLDAIGGRTTETRATWRQVLDHAPHHPAALSGLEATLFAHATATGSPNDWDALATHLGRMADAYGTETHLAAWLHVQRADVLERKVGRFDAAVGALERALQLDPGLGPVRNRLTRHAAAHGDWSRLAHLLEEEAGLETSDTRAARLELDAAVIVDKRLGDAAHACELLESATRRSPTAQSVDRRVLDELVRLHDKAGRTADVTRCRRARLRHVTDPAALAHELRWLGAAAERAGDLDAAIADVQRALAVDATDATLAETLDRLLAAAGKHDQRIAAWLQEAARTEDPAHRARVFARAASICEGLGRAEDALKHFRSAWIASPGDPDVLDALARLLAPAPSEAADARVRSLVEVYGQAAEQAREPGRKVAYLEKVALLWEEVLGDPSRAARAYSDVLRLEGDRRSAILGLERTAGRAGDGRTLARALLDEARLAEDDPEQLALRVRAARALAKHDPTRALQLVREVVESEPSHAEALELETQLEEAAGLWDLAARSLRQRIDLTTSAPEKMAMWLALAEVERSRLRAPAEALASLGQALALDPAHPVPAEEMARVLEDNDDPRGLRNALEQLASRARTPEDRARYLTHVAEIDELRLGDDPSAMKAYQRALGETPDDDLVVDRLARVMARCARRTQGRELAELAAMLGKRIDRVATTSSGAARAESFELAALLAETGHEMGRAAMLLESNLAEQPDHAPALRTLETLRRQSGDVQALSRALAKQGEDLQDARARLGALWSLAALEEWRLPVGDAAATYRKILELDPSDPGALEATVRHELGGARGGDPRARKSAIAALRALLPFAPDDDSRLAHQLGIALLLEACAADTPDRTAADTLSREALDRYRDALRIDPLSVSAATGLVRLVRQNSRLGDVEATLAASLSLADLAGESRARARYLVDAAEILLGPDDDPRLGARPDRRTRAASILERALDADPESIAAAGRLATVMVDLRQEERLVSAFRAALGRARSPDAVVMLGSEVARVARDDLKDLAIAIDAMQIVRGAAPQHVPSLLTLAELCIAQRVWPEAVSALEAVVSVSREATAKLTALFALASIYEKVLSRPGDVDRVLRAAVAIDGRNARALRALFRRVASGPPRDDAAAERARQGEIADLLERLAEVETAPDQRATFLVELSECRLRRGEDGAAERALVEAVAASPGNTRAFTRLASLFRRPSGPDSVGYARALNAVIGLGEEAGHVDARWFAALGQIEVQALSRPTEGIPHLRQAVKLDPTLHETRFELASALAGASANEEAARVLIDMLTPTSHPVPILAIADPAVALGLLERTLTAERRSDEAVVVSELLSIAGEVEETRASWLHARRSSPTEGATLDRTALVQRVFPAEAGHVLRDVSRAIAGIEGKVLRVDLGELGLTPRDRIGSRSGHPVRALLDRLARQLGVEDIELAVSAKAERTRVLAMDDPWVVVPASLAAMPESRLLASLARAVARVALGFPWLGELPVAHAQALLIGAARHVVPAYAASDLDPEVAKLATHYAPHVARAVGRKNRKMLEELMPRLTAANGAPPPSFVDFLGALVRTEVRTAFVLTGDYLSLVEDLATSDAQLRKAMDSPGPEALSIAIQHPIASDLARFALTPEASALRRRIGTTWSR
jgi:tetratricopeptide (TPR) repeat protein